MNLRELNHILIPSSERRARWAERPVFHRLERLLSPLLGLTREGMILAVLTLLSGAAGMDIRFSRLYLVFCGLFSLLFVALLSRRMARCPGLKIRIEAPPRVTVGELITFTALLHNEGPKALYSLQVSGPFLPWDGSWESAKPCLKVLEPGATLRLQISARFLLRGQRVLGRFAVYSSYPLGLYRGPRILSEPVSFSVLPPLRPLLALPDPPSIREPPDQRGRLYTAGESYELLGVRPYRPGDRIRDLHARSSARLGRPMVREYRRAARKRAVILLQVCGVQGPRENFDAAVTLTASLCDEAIRQEALVELLIDGPNPFEILLGAHVAGIEHALDALAAVQTGEREGEDLEGLLSAHLGHPGAAYLVFSRWSPKEAGLLERARGRCPQLFAFLLSPKPPKPSVPGLQWVRPGLEPLEIEHG